MGRRIVQKDFISKIDSSQEYSSQMRTSTAGGLKGGIPAHIKARITNDKNKLFS